MSGTNTTPDLAGLCERLREQKIIDAFSTPLGPVKKVSTNPDGPEAAAAIESLVAENERMREALVQADLTIRSLPDTDQGHVEFIRTILEGASDDR